MQLSRFPGHRWLAAELVCYHRSAFWKWSSTGTKSCQTSIRPGLLLACERRAALSAARSLRWERARTTRGEGVPAPRGSLPALIARFPREEKPWMGMRCTAWPPRVRRAESTPGPGSGGDHFVTWNSLSTFPLPAAQLLLPPLSPHGFSGCRSLCLNGEPAAEVSVSARPTFGKTGWITAAGKAGAGM